MSIVVAVRKKNRMAMACDTLQCFGSMKQYDDNVDSPKIRRIGSSLVGCTGWGVYDNILLDYVARKRPPELKDVATVYRYFLGLWKKLREGEYGFVKEQRNDDDSPFVDLDASFLILNRHGIFRVGSDIGVLPCRHYWAIGSGSAYAFGALHTVFDSTNDPGKLAETAVRTAMHFDDACGGEAIVMPLAPPPTRPAARRR